LAEPEHVPLSLLTLRDGRRIGYARSGEPDARPVLVCHGTPGSRLFRPADTMLADLPEIDLVTVDRPGYGRSTPRRLRTLLDWPDDVAALADHLHWDRFAVVGTGGGGPHALACAVRLGDRVTAVGLVSSLAPFRPSELRVFPLGSRTLSPPRAARDPHRFLNWLWSRLPDCDRRVLARPEVARIVAADLVEALRGNELSREVGLLRHGWGFTPADVDVPVLLWHGEADRIVPVTHGRRLAAALPTCHPTFVPEAGHYLIFDRWPAVLGAMPVR
jgi:pimeloyl-ACP methyl ester carboxylesterase